MKNRCYTGVWSNGKKTIDLDNLNTKAEMTTINECCFSSSPSSDCIYYATEKGTIICSYSYSELDDYYADLGPMYSRHHNYEILGRNFKKIKDQGDFDEEWLQYNECWRKRTDEKSNEK